MDANKNGRRYDREFKENAVPLAGGGRSATEVARDLGHFKNSLGHLIGHLIAPHWLAKVPAPAQPGQVWQSDITYLPTQEGWLYLSFYCPRHGFSARSNNFQMHLPDERRVELVGQKQHILRSLYLFFFSPFYQ
jgi:hypothetical protein